MQRYVGLVLAIGLMLLAQPGRSEGLVKDAAAVGNTAARVAERSLVAYVVQTKSVRTNCFTPALRTLLTDLRRKLGNRQITVTSGFRGAQRARRGSYHRRCMAADVQVVGVAPRKVAAVARSIPGIGGVGTYCHTRSVHVDVGPRRDWSWSCRKRRR
ncbi:YcbK family protein [Chthonobacter rhizosphaerae]|uniref:YcbK family protein n=1 Tax=Chthonobacter rhizosphaerae TaxID=2735553 RepID=UPI0015EF952A|nr:D-Ala-D-Ala carboxypeptidase family metallohydrolase [Chthonobacter rhizosphaerae]